MPTMSGAEQLFCRSAPWVWWTSRVVLPWALHGTHLIGDVLEVGAGSGSMAAATLARDPGLRLTLTDIDPRMVTAAQTRICDRSGVTARQADVTDLPFPDASFDFVTSYLMLHHVVEWSAALTEMRRVLKPGGQLLGYDLTATRAARVIHWGDRSPHRLLTPHNLEKGLTEAGFDDVTVRTGWADHVMRFNANRSSGWRPRGV